MQKSSTRTMLRMVEESMGVVWGGSRREAKKLNKRPEKIKNPTPAPANTNAAR
jgi:hypothetical protein